MIYMKNCGVGVKQQSPTHSMQMCRNGIMKKYVPYFGKSFHVKCNIDIYL